MMSHKYVVDTSAWVEYFGGTTKGAKLARIMETEPIATSVIALAELADKAERDNIPFAERLEFIKNCGTILPLSVPIALAAAKLKKRFRAQSPKFGLIDGIHLATALDEHAILLTADTDFRAAGNVMVV